MKQTYLWTLRVWVEEEGPTGVYRTTTNETVVAQTCEEAEAAGPAIAAAKTRAGATYSYGKGNAKRAGSVWVPD